MSFLPLRQLVWLTLSWNAYVGPRPRPEPVLQCLLAWAVGPAALTVAAAARAVASARAAMSAEVRDRRGIGNPPLGRWGGGMLPQGAAYSRAPRTAPAPGRHEPEPEPQCQRHGDRQVGRRLQVGTQPLLR